MSEERNELERMRRALLAASHNDGRDDATGEPSGGDPQRTWEAVHGDLSPEALLELADQALASPEAMEEWRLALEMQRGVAQNPAHSSPPRRVLAFPATSPSPTSGGLRPAAVATWRNGYRHIAAVAALGMVVILTTWQWSLRENPGRLRGNTSSAIVQLVESAPRDHFVLEWRVDLETDGGASYEIELTHGVDVVYRQSELEEPRLQVPQEALADLPSGSELLWTVDATLRDGSVVSSSVFKTLLQ